MIVNVTSLSSGSLKPIMNLEMFTTASSWPVTLAQPRPNNGKNFSFTLVCKLRSSTVLPKIILDLINAISGADCGWLFGSISLILLNIAFACFCSTWIVESAWYIGVANKAYIIANKVHSAVIDTINFLWSMNSPRIRPKSISFISLVVSLFFTDDIH